MKKKFFKFQAVSRQLHVFHVPGEMHEDLCHFFVDQLELIFDVRSNGLVNLSFDLREQDFHEFGYPF